MLSACARGQQKLRLKQMLLKEPLRCGDSGDESDIEMTLALPEDHEVYKVNV